MPVMSLIESLNFHLLNMPFSSCYCLLKLLNTSIRDSYVSISLSHLPLYLENGGWIWIGGKIRKWLIGMETWKIINQRILYSIIFNSNYKLLHLFFMLTRKGIKDTKSWDSGTELRSAAGVFSLVTSTLEYFALFHIFSNFPVFSWLNNLLT